MAFNSHTSSHSPNSSKTSSTWTPKQDKIFENALAIYDHKNPNLWKLIARDVGDKTVQEVKQHYKLLVHDIQLIEADLVPLPSYKDDGKGLNLSKDPEERIKNLKI